jgi:ribosomal protein S27E
MTREEIEKCIPDGLDAVKETCCCGHTFYYSAKGIPKGAKEVGFSPSLYEITCPKCGMVLIRKNGA